MFLPQRLRDWRKPRDMRIWKDAPGWFTAKACGNCGCLHCLDCPSDPAMCDLSTLTTTLTGFSTPGTCDAMTCAAVDGQSIDFKRVSGTCMWLQCSASIDASCTGHNAHITNSAIFWRCDQFYLIIDGLEFVYSAGEFDSGCGATTFNFVTGPTSPNCAPASTLSVSAGGTCGSVIGCCSPAPPNTLDYTIASDCALLDGLSGQLTYDATDGFWHSCYLDLTTLNYIGTCGITFLCNGVTGEYVAVSGVVFHVNNPLIGCSFLLSATPSACSPFSWSASGTVQSVDLSGFGMGTPCDTCDELAITLTVTG